MKKKQSKTKKRAVKNNHDIIDSILISIEKVLGKATIRKVK